MTELEKQKKLHNELNKTFNNFKIYGFWNHQHLCTFEMLPGRKYKKQKCRKWCREHPYLKSIKLDDRCECCEMFNYIPIDDEGCIVGVFHPSAQECEERYKRWFSNDENNYS